MCYDVSFAMVSSLAQLKLVYEVKTTTTYSPSILFDINGAM